MVPSNNGPFHNKLDGFLRKVIRDKRAEDPNYFNRLTVVDILPYLNTLPEPREQYVQRLSNNLGNIAGLRELLKVMVNHQQFAFNFLRSLHENNHWDMARELLEGLDIQTLPPCDEANFIRSLIHSSNPENLNALDDASIVNGSISGDSRFNIPSSANSHSSTITTDENVAVHARPVPLTTSGVERMDFADDSSVLEDNSLLSGARTSQISVSIDSGCDTVPKSVVQHGPQGSAVAPSGGGRTPHAAVIRHPLCDVSSFGDQNDSQTSENPETTPKELASELPVNSKAFQLTCDSFCSNARVNFASSGSTGGLVEEIPVKDTKANNARVAVRVLDGRGAGNVEENLQNGEPHSSPPSTDQSSGKMYMLCFAIIAVAVIVFERSRRA